MLSTRSHTPVSMIGSASIVKPGLTPVPSTATLARLASASIFFASVLFFPTGYDNSSVVLTIGILALRMVSICGITLVSDELVHSTTTSGLFVLSAPTASLVMRTLSFLPRPIDLARDPVQSSRGRCRCRRKS